MSERSHFGENLGFSPIFGQNWPSKKTPLFYGAENEKSNS